MIEDLYLLYIILLLFYFSHNFFFFFTLKIQGNNANFLPRYVNYFKLKAWLTGCGWAPAGVPGPADTSTAARGPSSPGRPRHREPRWRPHRCPPGSCRQRRSGCKTPALAPGGREPGRRGGGPWWWWRLAPWGLWILGHTDLHGPHPATPPASPNQL